jgi:hypothetical protein
MCCPYLSGFKINVLIKNISKNLALKLRDIINLQHFLYHNKVKILYTNFGTVLFDSLTSILRQVVLFDS